jgi:hypothetical protein
MRLRGGQLVSFGGQDTRGLRELLSEREPGFWGDHCRCGNRGRVHVARKVALVVFHLRQACGPPGLGASASRPPASAIFSIVAGAAAALSSALEAKNGRPAKPAEVRRILEATGTPQAGADHIGPLPNLVAAFKQTHVQ